jgi:hypothetical protein
MIRENHRLPWIMGGLSLATIAVAVTVSSTIGSAARKLPAPVPAASAAAPLSASPPASASVPAPAPSPAAPPPDSSLALEPVQPAGAPIAPGSQIWECTTNGQRTFSDKPCGGRATLREMNPLNVMNSAPMSPPVYVYPAPSGGGSDYYYPETPDAVNSSYPVVVGYPYAVRRRPDHIQRPYHAHAVAAPR